MDLLPPAEQARAAAACCLLAASRQRGPGTGVAEAVRLLRQRGAPWATPPPSASSSCARRSRATTGAPTGCDVDADDVVVTTGSSGGFLLAFLAAFEVGDKVAMARPGYPCYRNVLAALGCEVVEVRDRARPPASSRPWSRSPRCTPHARPERAGGGEPGQPHRHDAAARRARRPGHLVRGERRAAGLRRDLPRHRVRAARRRRAAGPQRVGDQPRGDRVRAASASTSR